MTIPAATGPELNRSELLQLYKIAIDEYHFQVQLNWQRSQYYFILNAAIIGAGISLIGIQGDRARPLACVLFGTGLLAVILAILVTVTQHNYYRATRESLKLLERRLAVGELAIQTTPKLGSRRRRIATVTTFNYAMLSTLGFFDIAGVAFTARSFLRAVNYIWNSL